jgi:hypothetical protein
MQSVSSWVSLTVSELQMKQQLYIVLNQASIKFVLQRSIVWSPEFKIQCKEVNLWYQPVRSVTSTELVWLVMRNSRMSSTESDNRRICVAACCHYHTQYRVASGFFEPYSLPLTNSTLLLTPSSLLSLDYQNYLPLGHSRCNLLQHRHNQFFHSPQSWRGITSISIFVPLHAIKDENTENY